MRTTTPFKVTYIGGPTVIIELAGLRFMTDPTLDPAGSMYEQQIIFEKTKGPVQIPAGNIDVVLLSHGQHIDNLDNAGRSLLNQVPRIYTTIASAAQLAQPCIGMDPWQTESLFAPDGTEVCITATPARHGPAGIERYAGEVTGFLLQIKDPNGLQLYITGDTVFFEGITEVSKRYAPDYVFIFAGAAQPIGPFNVTMGTNDAIDTAMAFPSALILPLHYEGWKHFTEDQHSIKYSFEIMGIDHRLKILEAGVPSQF